MSSNPCFFPLAAAGATAFALVAAIFVPYNYTLAADQSFDQPAPAQTNAVDIKTKLPDIKSAKVVLDQTDEDAALESVQIALTEIADGASYVWRREHGQLSGLVAPLASFKNTHGSVCRYAVVMLSATTATKRTEIVACRLPTGIWQIES